MGPLLPFLAVILYQSSARGSTSESGRSIQNESLEILIPAHLEPETLPLTLRSVREACAFSNSSENLNVRVRVGLSAWSTPEAHGASRLADEVVVIDQAGKWLALRELVLSSKSDWIALVDCGALWPADLVQKVSPWFKKSDVVALNPRYQPSSAGVLTRARWALEAALKKIENSAGGPISFHGATMFFRAAELRAVFRDEGSRTWLNDDVVLPYLIRLMHPHLRTVYLFDVIVDDAGLQAGDQEKRHARILKGNFQWIAQLVRPHFSDSVVLSFLALRRCVRLAWAWILLFLAFGAIASPSAVTFLLCTLVLLTALSFRHAFLVSLRWPFLLNREGEWR